MENDPIIIIPLYKKKLNEYETISLKQCFKILSNHKIVAVKPFNLELSHYDFPFDEVISFDNDFFSDIPGYNRLMRSSTFYERFLSHNFMLIYQPDAFVFKDDLMYWCESGYDYIGAPWLRYAAYPDLIKKFKNQIRNYFYIKNNIKQPGTDLPASFQLENRVGNGGFSLRNIRKFYSICSEDQEIITYYNSRNEYQFGEDVYWSIEVNRKKKRLNIPNYTIATCFSIENYTDHAFKITKGELPFGCHAWDRNLDVWLPIFKKNGIDLNSEIK